MPTYADALKVASKDFQRRKFSEESGSVVSAREVRAWQGPRPPSPLLDQSGDLRLSAGDLVCVGSDIRLAVRTTEVCKSALPGMWTPDDVGVVVVDKAGVCSHLTFSELCQIGFGRATPSEDESLFWRMGWAMVRHDFLVDGGHKVIGKAPEYDGYWVGDDVVLSGTGQANLGRILDIVQLENISYPMFLVGSTERRHRLVSDLGEAAHDYGWLCMSTSMSKGEVKAKSDGAAQPAPSEGDRLLSFFSSSAHDPTSPWKADYSAEVESDGDWD